MNRPLVNLLLILTTASCILFSCQNGINNKIGALQFDSIQTNTTAHLLNDSTQPACNLIVSFCYAAKSDKESLKDSINQLFIKNVLGESYQNMAASEAVNKYITTYVTNYRNDLEPLLKKDLENKEDTSSIAAWYSYYKKVNSNVTYYKGSLLTYRNNYEEFTGGAHGIYQTYFLNIDLNTCKPLHLEDLFLEDYQEALIDLLWHQLKVENQVESQQELEEMGYATTGELTPIDNFYLTNEGITFYYNVYDIAPYVMGPIQISIPYMLMEHLLNPNCSVLNEIKNN